MTHPPRNPFGPSRFFPDPLEYGEPDETGLIAYGLPLRRDILIDAYSHGIFPWPGGRGKIPWCSPEPRAVLPLDGAHWSERLLRKIRTGKFDITIDTDFPAVIRACASVGDRPRQMWITPTMQRAYCDLHEAGVAHCIAVRRDGELVGGVYGVAIRGFFAGESMFHTVSDGSKIALYGLVAHLNAREFGLFDIQMLTPHMARLGAREIARTEYFARLHAALRIPTAFHDDRRGHGAGLARMDRS